MNIKIVQVLESYFEGNSYSFASDKDENLQSTFIANNGQQYKAWLEVGYSQSGCNWQRFTIYDKDSNVIYQDCNGKSYHYDEESEFSTKTSKMIKLLSSYVGVLA